MYCACNVSCNFRRLKVCAPPVSKATFIVFLLCLWTSTNVVQNLMFASCHVFSEAFLYQKSYLQGVEAFCCLM